MVKGPRTPEEYLEVLERENIPIEAKTTQADLRRWIREHLNKPTAETYNRFWEAVEYERAEILPRGVREIRVHRIVRGEPVTYVRWGLTGIRGLFTTRAMRLLYKLPPEQRPEAWRRLRGIYG